MLMYDAVDKVFRKEIKKQKKLDKLSRRMRKDNRRLHKLNEDLLESLVKMNDVIKYNNEDIEKKDASISSLENQIALHSENHDSCFKLYSGFIVSWLMIFFMYQNGVVDHESFMVMNCCIIMTCIFFSFF